MTFAQLANETLADATAYTHAVIVPIRNEEENVPYMLKGTADHPRLTSQPGLHDIAHQLTVPLLVIFVDDSDHEKGAIASKETTRDFCGGNCAYLRVVHIVRPANQRPGRLSGAVKHGIEEARAMAKRHVKDLKIIVMDGDLQHNPAYIPPLFKEMGAVDLVATTRYTKGGSNEGLADAWRVFASRGSTGLAKGLFPQRLRGISDPMTGFYGFRSSALKLDLLRPKGFKILVETLLSHPGLSRSEIPFIFGERGGGESKGNLKEGLTFLSQLLEHRLRTLPIRIS